MTAKEILFSASSQMAQLHDFFTDVPVGIFGVKISPPKATSLLSDNKETIYYCEIDVRLNGVYFTNKVDSTFENMDLEIESACGEMLVSILFFVASGSQYHKSSNASIRDNKFGTLPFGCNRHFQIIAALNDERSVATEY